MFCRFDNDYGYNLRNIATKEDKFTEKIMFSV